MGPEELVSILAFLLRINKILTPLSIVQTFDSIAFNSKTMERI